MSDPTEMGDDDPRALLRQLETRARRRFGQHFLTRTDIVDRMVRGARVKPGDRVVEIGPGLGILTRALLRAQAEVIAVELDRDLAAFVRDTLPQVELIEGDAAKVHWEDVVEPGARVVANLPYNVGTTVVMQLLRLIDTGPRRFVSVTVMLQKEVVDRLMAVPGTKQYGALTVEAAVRAQPVYVLSVPPGAFHPPPKVQSSVVRLDIFDKPDLDVSPAHFDRVVRSAFSQRRKTLANSLGAVFGKERVRQVIDELGLDPQVRAERLDVSSFRAVAGALEEPG